MTDQNQPTSGTDNISDDEDKTDSQRSQNTKKSSQNNANHSPTSRRVSSSQNILEQNQINLKEKLGKISNLSKIGFLELEKRSNNVLSKLQTNQESKKDKKKKSKPPKKYDYSALAKKTASFLRGLPLAFVHFMEMLVGRIKLGTGYGGKSIDLLERIAKLKELGIITEEEFEQKKKDLLSRV